jgi:hypothetical protein
MNARWYNPGTARFMSEDTYPGDFSQTQTLNRYAYVMNNPVNQWDPTGHMAEDLFGGIVPSWVKAGETEVFQVDSNTYELWWQVAEPTSSPTGDVLVGSITDISGITETYQRSITNTWYYKYKRYLIVEDIPKITFESSVQYFSETETYEWDVFISAEEIAKGNQEKIRAMVGFPDNARLISTEVSVPYHWRQHQLREFEKQFRLIEPQGPNNNRSLTSNGYDYEITFESKRRVLGGYGDHPDPSALGHIVVGVVDYLYMDDLTTIKDPSSSPDEVVTSSFSLFFKPVGVAGDALKVSDDVVTTVVKRIDDTKGKGKPLQNHHYATNKSKKCTPQLESITKKYNLDLNDAWNKEYLPHQGRHPNAYHDYVLDNLRTFDNLAKGDRDKFLKMFEGLRSEIRNNPDMLYKDYWRLK